MLLEQLAGLAKAILAPPGARVCWSEIKNRLNPEFRAFVDSLIAAQA